MVLACLCKIWGKSERKVFGPFLEKLTEPERTAGAPGVCLQCSSVPGGAPDSARVPRAEDGLGCRP